jgi:Flp pilus assembly pilin Flp
MFPRPRYVFLDFLDDRGTTTVEYAIGLVMAAAFAMVLFGLVTSGTVADGLSDLIDRALTVTG